MALWGPMIFDAVIKFFFTWVGILQPNTTEVSIVKPIQSLQPTPDAVFADLGIVQPTTGGKAIESGNSGTGQAITESPKQ